MLLATTASSLTLTTSASRATAVAKLAQAPVAQAALAAPRLRRTSSLASASQRALLGCTQVVRARALRAIATAPRAMELELRLAHPVLTVYLL
jgi:hypothetical protein